VNRHGISQNPTREEVALLRRLWRADDMKARAHRAEWEQEQIAAENSQLRAENARLRAALALTEGAER
jgi:hypothetical protein